MKTETEQSDIPLGFCILMFIGALVVGEIVASVKSKQQPPKVKPQTCAELKTC